MIFFVAFLLCVVLYFPHETSQSYVRVGAFNIQVFGQSKIGDPAVVDVLIRIIRRFDLLLIQEVRDRSETAIFALLDLVNNGTETYNASVSRRLGRTTSKEQYAFFYKISEFQVLDSFHYHDSNDTFQREPFVVLVEGKDNGIEQFTLIPVHTDPDDAPVEISALVDVYSESVEKWAVEDSLILGDFNAGCNYVRSRDWPNILLWTDSRFLWLIGNDADTNIAMQSSCAYDRIVVAGDWLQSNIVNGSVDIFRFDEAYNLTLEEAKSVSDHYPVEVKLMTTTRSGTLASTNVPSVFEGHSSTNVPTMFKGRSSANVPTMFKGRNSANVPSVFNGHSSALFIVVSVWLSIAGG